MSSRDRNKSRSYGRRNTGRRTAPTAHEAMVDVGFPASGSTRLISWTICTILVVILTSILALRPITDSDFWHHISLGRIVVEEGRFPAGDELSYTALGRPWVSSGWLPSVLLYKAYKAFPTVGPVGLVVEGVIVFSALMLLFYGMWRTRNPGYACLLTLLALAAAYPRFLPRPDIFSQAFMVPLMALLVWYEESPLSLSKRNLLRAALLPVLFLAWANCHMLFVIGLAIAGLFSLWAVLQWKQRRRDDGPVIIAMMAISVLVCLATPYGISAIWFILENAQLHNTSLRINELKPTWPLFTDPAAFNSIYYFVLWALIAGTLLVLQRRNHAGWWCWPVIVLLFGLALIQRRQISIAAFGITPLLMSPAAGRLAASYIKSRYLIIIAVVFCGAVSIARFTGNLAMPGGKIRVGVNCDWYPCEAVSFLKQNPPPAGLFHDLYTGSYLGYQLDPKTKVFIDGRLEVFNNGTYDDFFGPPEQRIPLKELFAKYNVNSALLDWRSAAEQPGNTAAQLAQLPDWQLCWFSDHYALFVHKTENTAAYTAAHGYQYLNPLFPQPFMDALSNPATALVARAEAQRSISENPLSYLARKACDVAGIKVENSTGSAPEL